jgi:hypothetical protein
MIISIYINNEKLDLFNDETIEINSSVQDVSDITKNTTDFSKNFTVPASDNNNRIFRHYYNATIDNGFDARTRVSGRIEIDGFIFREGKISLLSAKVKQGRPSSYSIVFYGNLVSLIDLVKEDELTALDLSDYDHEYNSDNVKLGLENSLFGGDIVYPLFARKQYYYNSLSTANENTPLIANIAVNGGTVNGVRWSDLKPSITLISIVEAIEEKYGITFSRDFFGRTEFTNLYLWLNKDSNTDAPVFTQEIDFDGGSTTWVNLTTNTGTFSVYKRALNPAFNYRLFTHKLRVFPADVNLPYTILMYVNGALFSETEYTGNSTTTTTTDALGLNIITSSSVNYTVRYEIRAEENFTFTVEWENRQSVSTSVSLPPTNTTLTTTGSGQNILGVFRVSNNLPKIKVIDFLKGIFNMFKLVVVQGQTDGVIYVNDLNSYYLQGQLHDVTPYISTDEHEVERGKLLNEITYKFQDPKSILNSQFKVNTGQGYGDEVLVLEDEDGKPLDGTKQDYSVPFEQVVYERLRDLNGNTLTNVMYGAIIDDKAEPTNIKAHIHYVVRQSVGTKTVRFINDSNVGEVLSSFINLPSHTLGFSEPQFSTVFGAEVNEFTFETIVNTLFTNYHRDYILSIFNVKRRNFKFEAKLPISLMLRLKLNDVLRIKGEYYRINDFTTNLMTGKTKLNLINSFDNTINNFVASPTFLSLGGETQRASVYVTSSNKMRLAYDEDWITDAEQVGNNIFIEVSENTSGEQRAGIFTISDPILEKDIVLEIRQSPATIFFGNTNILFGNETITFE